MSYFKYHDDFYAIKNGECTYAYEVLYRASPPFPPPFSSLEHPLRVTLLYAPSINRNIRINIPRASFHVTLHPATMDDPSDPPSTAKTFRYERGWRVVSREVSKREGRKRVGWRNWPRDKTRESFNNGDLLLRERSFPFFLLLLFFFSSAKRSTKLAKTGCAARANISSRLTLRRGKSASVFLTRSVPSIPRSQHAGFRTFLREGGLYLKKKSRSRRRINS